MKKTETTLIEKLSDGEYHSGEELGQLMGVSRTAVWKQINQLEKLGIVVSSTKGKGYLIDGGVDLLSKAVVLEQLSKPSLAHLQELELILSTSSTNQLAKTKAEMTDATGFAVLAEQQTAGRGRRGREWVSPFGRNVYLSMVWGFDGGAEALEGLSLAVGVAVCRAAERCGVDDLQLKWPNDLLLQGKKVGGILLEVVGDPSGFCQVVVGVGLNVGLDAQRAKQIDQPWGNLQLSGPKAAKRSVVAGCVLDELLRLLASYQQTGFAPLRDEWLSRDAFANQPVRLVMVSREVKGVSRGVNGRGALLLEEYVEGQGNVVRDYSGGEISVRSLR